MTDFYVSVAKVEGSGDCEVEQILGRIRESIRYVYHHTIKAEFVDDNTLKVTHKER